MKADPSKIKYNLKYVSTIVNAIGEKVDMYELHWDSQTDEFVSLGVPHGRKDIAEYIYSKINK